MTKTAEWIDDLDGTKQLYVEHDDEREPPLTVAIFRGGRRVAAITLDGDDMGHLAAWFELRSTSPQHHGAS